MSSKLQPGIYVYATVPSTYDLGKIVPLATFREREGLTIIVEEGEGLDHADGSFRPPGSRFAAAFARRSTEANVSCNVVAAAYHDRIFVLIESAGAAMVALQQLQREGL